MSDTILWYVESDARTAESVAALLAQDGTAVTLLRPGATVGESGLTGIQALESASLVVALVSSMALMDHRFDSLLEQRLDAGDPIQVALSDVSAWEFALRRPRLAQQVGADGIILVPGALHLGQTSEISLPAPPAIVILPLPWPTSPVLCEAIIGMTSTESTTTTSDEPVSSDWINPQPVDTGQGTDTVPTTPASVPAPPGISPPSRRPSTIATEIAAALARPSNRQPRPTPQRSTASTTGRPTQQKSAGSTTGRPRARRSPGCTCLLWFVGLVGGLIALAVLATIAMIVLGTVFPDPADEATPGPTDGTVVAVVAEPTEKAATPTRPANGQPSPTVRSSPTVRPSPTTRRATTVAATRAPTAMPRADAPRLLRDTFGDADHGLLPTIPDDPAHTRRGYERGEYLLATNGGDGTPPLIVAPLAGTFANVLIGIDARLIGDPTDRIISLTCRDQVANGGAGYSLQVRPDRGQAALIRWESGRPAPLVDWRTVQAVRQNNQTNRLELRCLDGIVNGAVNGTTVASAIDRTYRSGVVWLGVTTSSVPGATNETRFDNLTVTAMPSTD